MASKKIQYSNASGYGSYALEHYGYNQAVRVGDRIEISGQGAWDPTVSPPTFPFPTDLKAQIEQAFRNIDFVLKEAGGKGIEQVYRINSYHPDLQRDALGWMKENLERWFPENRPIWTAVGVEKLAFPEMLIEIEAVAYDPK